MAKCRITNDSLFEVIDFGKQPLGNGFLDKSQFNDEYFFSMKLGFNSESKMVQLFEQPEPQKMFHEEYAFFSSTSTSMDRHFRQFYEYIVNSDFYKKYKNPFVIEIGCNDGILLKNFAEKNVKHLGIEPSLNVAEIAKRKGVKTISKFFTENLAKEIISEEGKADVILSANVMCHIPNILDVVAGIKALLKDTGVLVFEDPYLGDVIKKTSYDQIYDEHVFLFSAISVQYLFNMFDLEIIELLPQKTHGGSMRYVIANKGIYKANQIVNDIISEEERLGLNDVNFFQNFSNNIKDSKEKLIDILQGLKAEGKSIAGYAATSKSTTILNYCQIGPKYLDYICDTTPIKQNKFSPGMHIPIVSHDYFINNPPDVAFLLAWNHSEEIMNKEKKFIENGGKRLINVPSPMIL